MTSSTNRPRRTVGVGLRVIFHLVFLVRAALRFADALADQADTEANAACAKHRRTEEC